MNKNQRGVGMIEVLVSILVLGVGALGVATMQLTGLKYNTGSHGRSQAVFMANDMMDRIRANREFAMNSPIYNTNGFIGSESDAPPFDCYTNTCAPSQLAMFDRWHFLNQVETLLPFGLARIETTNSSEGRVYNITLQWRNVVRDETDADAAADADDETSEFTFSSAI